MSLALRDKVAGSGSVAAVAKAASKAAFEEALLAEDVLAGFSQELKSLPPRWFYDAEGSRLFSEIMDLPEYYLTAKETEILQRQSPSILKALGSKPYSFVELGAGDGRKTQHLLREALKQKVCADFRPIDVSIDALNWLSKRMTEKFPNLQTKPIVGDNIEALREISASGGTLPLCVLFLGSSVGNCRREEVLPYLKNLRGALKEGDHVLIGFDLVKESSRLVKAYADSSGVTRAFNMNLLTRLNRELQADFNLTAFAHEATWNPRTRAMESWLVSKRDQSVYFGKLGRSFHFKKWEEIHTETSLKFGIAETSELAVAAGFEPVATLTDSAQDFVSCLWKVKRPDTQSKLGIEARIH
jgi:L-histidine Nalpha-methyltransferase